jgi:hypothetical protein
MNRRAFLSTVPALIAAGNGGTWFDPEDEDALLCRQKFTTAVRASLAQKMIGVVVVGIGKSFIGTDYVANALEIPGEERLVVNLRGLDCVSFYENALVFARCIKKKKTTFEHYKQELQFIRYRGGVIDAYPSRLHYTSDYFYDNAQRGVWKLVAEELGGERLQMKVNFMSTHPDAYRQIKENPTYRDSIAKQEALISARETYFVPKERVASIASNIRSGDILGITTNIDGLDCSHTGIACWQRGRLHLLHAPNVGYKVQISEKSLAEYLAGNNRQTGVMIARPLEPKY